MFDLFLSDPFTFMVCVFTFSLCIGSFLNVVAYRLPIMMRNQAEDDYYDLLEKEPKERPAFNLSKPHSACPQCKSPIKPWQNIPVISYLWLKGNLQPDY
jgi:leader peptidase (prepilin peptidase)/N-methyltransferase